MTRHAKEREIGSECNRGVDREKGGETPSGGGVITRPGVGEQTRTRKGGDNSDYVRNCRWSKKEHDLLHDETTT